jgi:hypothetical protein
MSASPPTPDVSLRGNELTLRAKNRTGPKSYGLLSGFGEHIVGGHGQPDALDGELTH